MSVINGLFYWFFKYFGITKKHIRTSLEPLSAPSAYVFNKKQITNPVIPR